jgi:chromate reductase
MKPTILAFSGSLRKNSTNSGLLRAVIEQAGDQLDITVADISTLPLFNQDLEANFPADATELKNKIRAASAIIMATPEYNRSIPGALKNMLDWTSWKGKLVATMGASSGGIGTALAQYDLKKILLYLNARVLGQPEFYVGVSGTKFDKEGNLTDEKTKEYIKKLLETIQKSISEQK